MALWEGLWEGLWKTSENFWKPLKTSENLRKFLKTSQNLWKSLRTSEIPPSETLSEADFPLRTSQACCPWSCCSLIFLRSKQQQKAFLGDFPLCTQCPPPPPQKKNIFYLYYHLAVSDFRKTQKWMYYNALLPILLGLSVQGMVLVNEAWSRVEGKFFAFQEHKIIPSFQNSPDRGQSRKIRFSKFPGPD